MLIYDIRERMPEKKIKGIRHRYGYCEDGLFIEDENGPMEMVTYVDFSLREDLPMVVSVISLFVVLAKEFLV